MNEKLFLQKRYININDKLAKYGCYVLTLCYVSQFLNKSPLVFLESEKKLLETLAFFQSKEWLDNDYVVIKSWEILTYLTGSPWTQLEDSHFGLYGKAHFIPINYPVNNFGCIEIACMRAKEDINKTHFILKGKNGDTIFNSLGKYWENDQEGRFFDSDKRVLIPA